MKKLIITLSLFFIFCMPTYASTTLYQKVVSSPISSGATLKNYIRLTDSGWQNINVLEVNLDDKYTNLGLLTSSNGIGTLQNILTMADNAGAIAAINADFFQANSGKGNAVGLTVEDNEVISSSYYGNLIKDEFATFLLDDNNSIFYDYLTNNITLTSQKTKKGISVGEINKYPRSFDNICIYTPAWGNYSHGSNSDLALTEMVVNNNKVVEIRYNQEAVEIPSNGFVVSCSGEGAEFIKDNFKKGTKVKLDIEFNIDIDKVKLAVSGGAILLKNGIIPDTFSSNITGNNPRTAIGSSKDESTIYLVTVDGRQKSSIGITQTALAEFLKEIGVYNAINLDGGGSTTMVARKLGYNDLSIINYPSNGNLRNVINGIGVFNSAPSSNKVANLVIEMDETNIFKGKEKEITVKGYNKYYNPVEINEKNIKWSYDGVPINVYNGVISGDEAGTTILTAKLGNAKASIEINILGEPSELSLFPKKSTITSGKSISFTASAKDKSGYSSTLNGSEITWKLESFSLDGRLQNNIPNDASIKNGTFTATTSGDYIISISNNEIKSYALITVSGKVKNIIYDFETQQYSFDPYPDEVIGDAAKSDEQSHSGSYSAKLSYDFNQDIAVRATYIELNGDGINIPNNTTDISFWLYNDSKKEENIKIKIKDADNHYHLIVVQKGITHTGWKEFTYSLNSIPLPGKITDIYLAQDDISVQSSGYVYIDDLTFYQESTAITTKTKLPEDIKGYDEQNKYTDLENEESFRIAVFDEFSNSNLMINKFKNKKIEETIQYNSDISVFTSSNNISLENDKIINCSGYSKKDYKNSTFITVDSSKGGVKNTNSTQWITIQNDIKESKSDNIFIIMNSTLDAFADSQESRFWMDMLCDIKNSTSKNIWVLHYGNYVGYSMDRGIKYLSIGNNHNIITIPYDSKYTLITVNGKELNYEIKNIF